MKRNETKRKETKRNKTKRNEKKRQEAARNETKGLETPNCMKHHNNLDLALNLEVIQKLSKQMSNSSLIIRNVAFCNQCVEIQGHEIFQRCFLLFF